MSQQQLLQLLKQLSPHLLAPTTFLLFFALPPFPFRKTLYLVTFLVFFYFSFFSPSSSSSSNSSHVFLGSSSTRLALALVWMYYLDWLTKMCLHVQPEHDFWRVMRSTTTSTADTTPDKEKDLSNGDPGTRRNSSPGMGRKRAGAYLVSQPHGFSQKLPWAFSLVSSPRGVGWNYRILHGLRPKETIQGKWLFVATEIVRCLGLLLFSEAASTLLLRWNNSSGDGYSRMTIIGVGTIRGWDLMWEVDWKKLALVPLVGIKVWADTEAQYAGVCAVFVGVGLTSEEDCKPLFGNNLFSLDSLQEFWGTFWHQSFRRMLQDLGRSTCRFLRVHGHTQLRWFVQVWVSFLVSGLVHGFAVGYALAATDPANSPEILSWEHCQTILGFFLLQALGLTLETLFLDTPVKDITLYEVGLEDEMIMGRIWTWGWLLMTGYWAFDSCFAVATAPKPVILTFLKDWISGTEGGWATKLGWYISGDGGLLE